MTDLFISYSRKDIAFARILHEKLKEQGLETWIDWQDIPPSADWLAEVFEAIEQADSFVFIISPTAVASEICGLEIEHAVKNNKRLIPIVLHDVDAAKVPQEIAAINWIFFEDHEDEYRAAIENLINAIRTDQIWVKEHTRLQTRALEWERHGEDPGYLLRGADLAAAEGWLAGAAEKDPAPTALQTRYLLAARGEATRRQRRTLAAVAAGLVLAITLGILAWTQRNTAVSEAHARATAQAEAVAESHLRATAQAEAEEQSRIAIEQSELAISRFLSAQSLASIDDQLDLALLLAVQAVRISPTMDARGSLFAALNARPNLEAILTKQSAVFVHALGLSSDGNTLAASYYKRIEIWDLEKRELIAELATPENLANYWGLTFVSGTERLLGCHSDKVDSSWLTSCRMWDIESGEDLGLRIRDVRGTLAGVTLSLAVSPDGGLASVADEDNAVYIYSLEDGEQLFGPLAGHESGVTSAAFNPEGTVLATGDEDGKVVLWDVKTGTPIGNRIRVLVDEEETSTYGVTGLAFSPDGMQLLAAGDGKSVLFTVETVKLKKRMTGYDADRILAYFTPDGTPVVCVKSGDRYVLWNALTGEFIGGQPNTSFLTGEIEDEVIDPVHMRLITASKLNSVMGANILIWDLNKRVPFGRHFAQDEAFKIVEFHPDGLRSLFATSGVEGEVRFWDPSTGEQIGEPMQGHTDKVEDLAFSLDGALLASAGDDHQIILWDVESQTPIGDPLSGHENAVYAVAFNPVGTLLASTAPLDAVPIRIWDLSTQPPASELLGSGYEGLDHYHMLAFSPDGQTLAVCGTGDHGGRVTIWDIPSRSVIAHLDSDMLNRATEAVVFGPDGRTLLTAGIAGVRIWDYVDQKVLAEPPSETLDPPYLQAIALSPDGRLLASITLHNELTLWDGITGQMLAAPIYLFGDEHTSRATDTIAFSPDGDQVAVVGDYGILLLDMRLESWMEAACQMANRDLTPAEWRTYLGERPYEATCP
jgi:WD40 repeat protein